MVWANPIIRGATVILFLASQNSTDFIQFAVVGHGDWVKFANCVDLAAWRVLIVIRWSSYRFYLVEAV